MNLGRLPRAGARRRTQLRIRQRRGPICGVHHGVQPVVRGIQSAGVMANAKHFLDNNQEADRRTVNAVVDERTQHQLYLPPFEGAVKAGVLTVMCSYQKINGEHACESAEALGYLKRPTGLNFSGFVMSDWGATHSTYGSAKAGLDQDMPGSSEFYSAALRAATLNGSLPRDFVDGMVTRNHIVPRILRSMFSKARSYPRALCC